MIFYNPRQPERNKLLGAIHHLLRMVDGHELPARFCRRELRKLCKRLSQLRT